MLSTIGVPLSSADPPLLTAAVVGAAEELGTGAWPVLAAGSAARVVGLGLAGAQLLSAQPMPKALTSRREALKL
ncbi:MAG: hypothetical protein ABJB12_10350 [Pseudomonadota bacterium]